MDFASVIKYGDHTRFLFYKENLPKVAGPWYEEIKHIANELYDMGLREQAKKFVELAYLHLHNKDFTRYTIVRHQYGGLINDYESGKN